MISTAADYLRFCQMLLNGGELDGVRLLSPITVSHMTVDHLSPAIAISATALNRFSPITPSASQGQGFGLGFAVRTVMIRATSPCRDQPGVYYSALAQPARSFGSIPIGKSLIAIMMVQNESGTRPLITTILSPETWSTRRIVK